MRAHTHIAFGLFLFGSLQPILNLEPTPKFLALLTFACLLPDIDRPNSAIGSLLRPLSNYLYSRFGHRTATHSILALFLLLLALSPLLFFDWRYLAFFGIGYISHLIADGMNTTGIPLCWPNSRIFFFVPQRFLIPVGGKEELLFFGTFSFLSFLLFSASFFGYRNLIHLLLPSFEGVMYGYSVNCDGAGQKDLCYVNATVCGEYCGSISGLALGILNNGLVIRDSDGYKKLEKGTTLGAKLIRQKKVKINIEKKTFENVELTEILPKSNPEEIITLRGELFGEFICTNYSYSANSENELVFKISSDRTKLTLNHILASDLAAAGCLGFVKTGWIEYKARALS